MLFVHGIPTSGRLWDYVVPAFKDKFMCVVVDLPGTGESPPLPGGVLDPDACAQALDQLRQHLSIPLWHIVGHDAGATIAVHYAARFGTRVHKLVLCSPPIFPEFKVPWFFQIMRTPVIGECVGPLMMVLLWRVGLPSTIKYRDASTPQIIRAFHRPFTGYRGLQQFLRLLRWGEPSQVLAQTAQLLQTLRVPTLVIHGKADGIIPLSFATRAAMSIPGAELYIMECNHFLPLSCPEALCTRMLRFFDPIV